MSMGSREDGNQTPLWVATSELARGEGHVFYRKLKELLARHGFDEFVDFFAGTFALGPVRVGVIGAVFNVLDTEIATAIDGNVGAGGTPDAPTNPRFGFATTYQRPRSYEAGFRIEF